MGNTLPKDLINAERTKLLTHEGIFNIKASPFENFSQLEEDNNWEKVKIKVHLARLDCIQNDIIKTYPIDCNFLIISQNPKKKEVVIGLMNEQIIWKLQVPTIREFLDFTDVLIQSKIPSWVISPVCQVCSKSFSLLLRRHHCRNCGKNVCKVCTRSEKYNIEGFYKLKKVCSICVELIKSQIGLVEEIHRSVIVRNVPESRSMLLPCPSKPLN